MSRRKLDAGKAGASLVLCTLLVFGSGCQKKVPPPPPAPAPAAQAPAPAPAPPRPTISSFTAEPDRIERGQTSTLHWSVEDATEVSINEIVGNVESSGSREVTPSASTTYTLTASGTGGTDSRSVTVEVIQPPPSSPPAPARPTAAEILASKAQDAYFDFDKSNIRPDAQQVLILDAPVLKQIFADYPGFTVVVEGHCDERGSAEYNMALGDRRARSAKEYLVQLGVSEDALKIVSYGKERPVCTEHTEDCFQRNRHVHFSPRE